MPPPLIPRLRHLLVSCLLFAAQTPVPVPATPPPSNLYPVGVGLGAFAPWSYSPFEDTLKLPDADPDSDGHSNLLEFAPGTHPLISNPDNLLQSSLANGRPSLTFLRATDALAYEVLASSDLSTWETIVVGPGEIGFDVTVEDPNVVLTNQPRFVRLFVFEK